MKASPSLRRAWLSLALILLLAAGLRFARLGAPSLWNDEGNSAALAGRSLAQIARDAANDIHPPLYYWLLSGWTRLVADPLLGIGTSEVGLRSLSALLGVGLVALIYALGVRLAGRWTGLAAALLAAANPFQIYYSQEARMYMLLAALGALAMYAGLMWAATEPGEGVHRWGILYLLTAAAGLYTHYAFPLALAAANLAVLLQLFLRAHLADHPGRALGRRLWRWAALQVGALILFAPWLPVAARQLAAWPRVTDGVDFGAALLRVAAVQFTGPARPPTPPLLGWMALLVLLLALLPWPRGRPAAPPATPLAQSAGRGGARLHPAVEYLAPAGWFLLPLALFLGLGLYKEAYLKFLLVASPAASLLLGRMAASIASAWGEARPWRRAALALASVLVLACSLTASGVALAKLYGGDPDYARDDYRGIATYIDAVGRPPGAQAGDAVVLNAPGQQEVFRYYYAGDLPVHPLPRRRPLDRAATEAELQALARPGGRVFAVLWGTDESDPQRVVEGWLDAHAFQALDAWYGNVRLAVYAVPAQVPAKPDQVLDLTLRSADNGDEIRLWGLSLLDSQLAAGDIAQITLFWQAAATPQARYTAFVHLLDAGNHIVGQRDAEPGGGARPTTSWEPGETLADNMGVPVHPATPPGEMRVEVGLYDAETGRRLTTAQGEGQVWLPPVSVIRPPAPAPLAALGMEQPHGTEFGELALLGYDAHRLGYGADAPLHPGDVLHLNLYWKAAAQPRGRWQVAVDLLDSEGREQSSIAGDPVGGYPTTQWQAGDVWRGQFNLVVPASAPPGRYRLRVQPSPPQGETPAPFLTGWLEVVP